MLDLVWDDLRYFIRVTSEGSVAGAARGERVEHSTVARRITRLETTMNVRLFNRLARGWVLTEEGEMLKNRVAVIGHQMFDLERFAQSLGAITGSVTLTAPPEFLSEVLMPVLTGFHKAFPEVELRLLGEMKEANLSKGEADIALRMTEVGSAELVIQKLCDVTYQFYGNAEVQKTETKLRRFIGYSATHQSYLNDALLKHSNERPIALRTSNLRVALTAACEGVGIALLPTFLAAKCSDLQIIDEAPVALTRPVYLVMQRDIRNSHRVRMLADYIKRKLPRLL